MDIKTVAIKKLIGQNIRTLAELKGPLVVSQFASSASVFEIEHFLEFWDRIIDVWSSHYGGLSSFNIGPGGLTVSLREFTLRNTI